jgi:hypothetical protein
LDVDRVEGMNENGLTQQQIAQQDFGDNRIFALSNLPIQAIKKSTGILK